MTNPLKDEITRYTLTNGLRAQISLLGLSAEKLVKDYRHRVSHALLMAGVTLIPSDLLDDNQFVVSRGVYNAAREEVNLKEE